LIIIVMGVAGTGKSTLAKALASALGWILIEGDDYHTNASIEKMASGEALDDDDRVPWLEYLHEYIAELDAQGASAVVACSALKASYRTLLSTGIGEVRFVYLYGNTEIIAQRMLGRREHFMPSNLLESQLDALEPPDDAIMVSVDLTTEEQADSVLQTIAREQRP
jgi:gluconokinase